MAKRKTVNVKQDLSGRLRKWLADGKKECNGPSASQNVKNWYEKGRPRLEALLDEVEAKK